MSNLITIQNVRGYLDYDGTAYLNLEDVARGLGFTQIKDSWADRTLLMKNRMERRE